MSVREGKVGKEAEKMYITIKTIKNFLEKSKN